MSEQGSEMSGLPKWPDRGDLQPMTPAMEDIAASQILYERAMKEAYAARLKVAVDALRNLGNAYYFDEDGILREITNWQTYADKAADAIGELP